MWSCVRVCVGVSGDSMQVEKKRKTQCEGTDPEGFIPVTSILHSIVSASTPGSFDSQSFSNQSAIINSESTPKTGQDRLFCGIFEFFKIF